MCVKWGMCICKELSFICLVYPLVASIFIHIFVRNLDENSGKTLNGNLPKIFISLEIYQYYLYSPLKLIIISEKESLPSSLNVFHISVNAYIAMFEQFVFQCLIVVKGIDRRSGDSQEFN